MKKLFFLLALTLSFACDSSDDDGNIESNRFHPPTWIQGTWFAYDSELTGVRFTTSDFCTTVTGIETCYQSAIEESDGLIVVEDETISDTDYEFEIDLGLDEKFFHYRKKSDTEMVLIVQNLEAVTYIKQ